MPSGRRGRLPGVAPGTTTAGPRSTGRWRTRSGPRPGCGSARTASAAAARACTHSDEDALLVRDDEDVGAVGVTRPSSVPGSAKLVGGICWLSPTTTTPRARPSAPTASGDPDLGRLVEDHQVERPAPAGKNRASESGLTSTHGVIAAISSPYVLISDRTLRPPRLRAHLPFQRARPCRTPHRCRRAGVDQRRRQHRDRRRSHALGRTEKRPMDRSWPPASKARNPPASQPLDQ